MYHYVYVGTNNRTLPCNAAPQKWVECQLGLCPGQEASSTFLDLDYAQRNTQPSSQPAVNPTCMYACSEAVHTYVLLKLLRYTCAANMGGELQLKETLSANDVARIQRNVRMLFTAPNSGTSSQDRRMQ